MKRLFHSKPMSKRLYHFTVVLVFLTCLILPSCKKNPSNLTIENPSNFHDIFKQFWSKMNDRYVYWDKENTNWDGIYSHYAPLFDKLTNSDADVRQSLAYFKQMTAELVDSHFKIIFKNHLLIDSTINPAISRKMNKDTFHSPYQYNEIVQHYLDEGFLSEKGNIVNNGALISATSGTINGNLLYFHCNFFSLKQSWEANDNNKVNQILSYFFAKIKKEGSSIKGIIIDLRNNTGGNLQDLNFLAGKLVNTDVVFGYSRSKNGLGKMSYLPWLEAKIKHDPTYNVTVPIVLLGDAFSASLSETLIVALKTKKNCSFIGEQTYGATGPISDPLIFNSGSFDVGDFMSVETSSVEFKGLDGSFYESKGITPDINLPFNLRKLSQGIDEQLEAAIKRLNDQAK